MAIYVSILIVLLSADFCRTLTRVNLTTACNANCHCVPDVFEPVCGADHLVYFSPCYAGCHNTSADRKVGFILFGFLLCISQPVRLHSFIPVN